MAAKGDAPGAIALSGCAEVYGQQAELLGCCRAAAAAVLHTKLITRNTANTRNTKNTKLIPRILRILSLLLRIISLLLRILS